MKMVEVQNEDLADLGLDWALAKAEGKNPIIRQGFVTHWGAGGAKGFQPYSHSNIEIWPDMIEDYNLSLNYANGNWSASMPLHDGQNFVISGKYPAEAICRCVIRKKLGLMVLVPSILVKSYEQ